MRNGFFYTGTVHSAFNMLMIRNLSLLLLVGLLRFSGYAQPIPPPLPPDSFPKAEELLKSLMDSVVRGSTDHVREGALAAFNPLFFDLLGHPQSFNYSFDSLRAISKVKSPDGRIRVITWAIRSIEEGTYHYYGVVQHLEQGSGKLHRTGLSEFRTQSDTLVHSKLLPGQWFPALYYSIIERKAKKSTYYFLLGWQGRDRFANSKVIEVLTIDQWNNPHFGAPVFFDEENKMPRHRVIFSYSSEAVMMLKYHVKKKMIVFDHLSPVSPSAKGQYRYYGPDFTYDGYVFRKGMWQYKKNLDLRNEK